MHTGFGSAGASSARLIDRAAYALAAGFAGVAHRIGFNKNTHVFNET
jgi:hypothetical protein